MVQPLHKGVAGQAGHFDTKGGLAARFYGAVVPEIVCAARSNV